MCTVTAPQHQHGRNWMRGARPPAWLLAFVVGLILFEITRRAVLATDNPRLLPAMVLFGTLVVPVTFLAFVRDREVHHDVSPAITLAVATVGGCLSVVAAAILENAALQGSTFGPRGQLPVLVVGLVEESAKLLVIVIVLFRLVPGTPINGLMVGVAVGTGFAVLETLGYGFVAYVQEGGGMAALDADLVTRSLFTPATHIAWAGLTGCAIGYATSRHWRRGPLVLALVTLAAVTLLHALWDRATGMGTYGPLTILDLTLLAVAAKLAGAAATSTSVPL